MVHTFVNHYWSESCNPNSAISVRLQESDEYGDEDVSCESNVAFLSLILMLGTLWLGVTLYDFTKTPFLNKSKREYLSDYALPVAVIVFSLVGSVLFSDVKLKYFEYQSPGENSALSNSLLTNGTNGAARGTFQLVDLASLRVVDIFGAMGLGFSLSLLFFMDQNIRY